MADVIFEAPQNSFRRFVDMGDGTHSEMILHASSAGFFSGKEFRTFHEFSINTSSSIVLRAVSTVDVLLESFTVEIDTAKLRVEWYSGGTAGGTWSTDLPILRTNQMSTAPDSYTSGVTMTAGGTLTGGTLVDVFALDAGIKKQAAGVTDSQDQPLGLPAGTYFIKLINTDGETCTGFFKARWEER